MRKRTMWLARSAGEYSDAKLYATRPKTVGGKGKGIKCGCGATDCWALEPTEDIVPSYEGLQVDSFCEDGLINAGISLRPGELVKVTLESVR